MHSLNLPASVTFITSTMNPSVIDLSSVSVENGLPIDLADEESGNS